MAAAPGVLQSSISCASAPCGGPLCSALLDESRLGQTAAQGTHALAALDHAFHISHDLSSPPKHIDLLRTLCQTPEPAVAPPAKNLHTPGLNSREATGKQRGKPSVTICNAKMSSKIYNTATPCASFLAEPELASIPRVSCLELQKGCVAEGLSDFWQSVCVRLNIYM